MSRRILLIDDDDHIRMVASTTLELLGGFDVTTAASGQEGFDLALDDPPDAIVLDVMMPGLDGPATVELLRGRPETRDIPVILLTAKVHAADVERLSALDVSGVMVKPFDPHGLPRELAATLGWDEPS